LTSDDPKQIVASGYDRIAGRYAEWAAAFETPVMRWVEDLVGRLRPEADVLELGCGGGSPATRALAHRHRVTGVDISRVQVQRARSAVPCATFIHADATAVELEDASFDAVVSLFMLGHVPRAEQGPLLRRIACWLRPGGFLLATMGVGGSADAVEDDWLGAPMFFASYDRGRNRALLTDAGLDLVRERVIPIDEPGHGPVSFMWVLGRKPLGR
jgi:ubiquinone/menaquinone biosynthesis C-methylase UbiE